MTNEEELIQRWTALLKGTKSFVVGTVKEVTGNTCKVLPLGSDVEIHGVKISFDGSANTVFTPAFNSVVVVGKQKINKLQKEYFIVQCTKVETVKIHGETFGGLVKANILKTELDKTNEVVNTIVNTLLNWTVASSDGGAALKLAFTAAITGKTVGDYSSIENESVKHG
jgi:hypothetical protein